MQSACAAKHGAKEEMNLCNDIRDPPPRIHEGTMAEFSSAWIRHCVLLRLPTTVKQTTIFYRYNHKQDLHF